MAKTAKFKNYTLLLTLAALLVFVMAGWLWWVKVYQDPARVFGRMLNNNLKTLSVTRTATQQNENGSIEQNLQLSFANEPGVHALTTIKQQASLGENRVVTETIGTVDSDYVRYQDIKTFQKNEAGQDLDFSKVVGVWSKQAPPTDGTRSQFFNEAILNVAVFGNVKGRNRQILVNHMQDKLYKVDYASVRRSQQNGRSVYAYDVTVNPANFADFFKAYARIIGIGSFTGLDEDDYKNAVPFEVTMSVDILSGQLVSVLHKDNELTEYYGSYGLLAPVSKPPTTISVEEIQQRLQRVN